jgi:hypothetical protein
MPTCGVSETQAQRAGQDMCRWPQGHRVTWGIASTLPGWARSSQIATFERSFAMWSLACGVLYEFTPNASQANIPIGTANLGRGVLADAMLPCGRATANSQLPQRYGLAWKWVDASNPAADSIDLFRVAGHETGHSNGIGHNLDPNSLALLDPTYSLRIRSLQSWDIMQAIARYGPAAPLPDPDDPEPPKSDEGHAADRWAKVLDELARLLRHDRDLRDAVGKVWRS